MPYYKRLLIGYLFYYVEKKIMKLMTKAFGLIDVSEKQKLTFKNGLLGFEDIHTFFMLDFDSGTGSPFYWLQAENIPEIAFLVIEPGMIDPEYKLDADKSDLMELEITDMADVLMFSIVTVNDNPSNITANLLGPIIINKKNHKAKQIISLNDKYSVREPLLSEREAKC